MNPLSLRQFEDGIARGFSKYFWLCALICLPCARFAFSAEVQPGFDCNKATTATEKLICQDRDLRWADHTMADTYQFRLKALSSDARQVLIDDQREWLARRAKACTATGDTRERTYCLLNFYQNRNRVLLAKFWLGSSPSPVELAEKLNEVTQETYQQGLCPINRDFDLEYYEHMAADQRKYSNPIFDEIPRGLKAEEVKEDFRLIDVTPDRVVPSNRVPVFNRLNPHHGTGDSRMKIYCRIQDTDGVWWLAHREPATGLFTYFLSSEMVPVPAGQ
jgi:uncharacterized protein YecT (DUF1311 family)